MKLTRQPEEEDRMSRERRLNLSPYLTRGYSETLEHQIRTTHAGQAHFANTGPFGATCGECVFLGYFQQIRNEAGDTVRTVHRRGCKKFYELTNAHGPVVPSHAAACRYFQRKENSND
jgi:hypothetical protein